MSHFRVDAHDLLVLRSQLGTLRDRLLALPAASAYDGLLGGRALEAELTDFCTTWHHGVTDLCDDLAEMMRRLVTASEAYLRAEQKVKDAGSGSGTTTISGNGTVTTTTGGAPVGGGHGGHGGHQHPPGHHGSGSGSGTTVIGGPNATAPGKVKVHSPLLTSDQEVFVGTLASLTGLAPRVVAAWALAEESSTYAKQRQADDNNNWLNIGYFDSGAGSIAFNSAFRHPTTAAEQTAKFLKGKWGGASSSIRSILRSAGESPEAQIHAIASSNWASSHYDDGRNLQGTYDELAGLEVTPA